MSTPAYAWKTSSRHSISAQVAGEEISRLRDEVGDEFFTPADVVDAARPPSSPLHPEFEWDDRKAATEFRNDQARHLIDHITVVETQSPSDQWTRAFVSVRTEDGPRFTSTAYAFSVPSLREDVLNQALSDLRTFERRYNQFVELAHAIDVLKVAVTKAKRRIRTTEKMAA